jgi:outer membrane protein assembly factor BamB
VAAAALVFVATIAAARAKAAEPQLVTHEQAARHGLERAWFAQVPVDASRSRVTTWFLYFDRIYGVTNSGIVTALNAETGEQLWTKQVGKPGYPAFGPGANADFLGVVSGSTLYMLNRHDGRLAWRRQLGSAPSSGPALSDEYAYVAMVTGRIEGYELENPATQPWYYQSNGRTFLRPTVTGDIVSWPTTNGYLYASRAEDPGVLYRLETSADIVTSPAAMEPYLYIASLDGYLYCLHQITGDEQWRFSTGYAIESSPAIVGGNAYVASIEPAIHALDAKTGKELWAVSGASHFAARGKGRVYASDHFGNLLVLDAKSGAAVSRMPVGEGQSTLVNDQSDRIFLVNDRGLVQCLHEIGAGQATLYRQPPAPSSEETGAATQTAAPEVSPFDEGEAAEPDADPEAAGDEPSPFEPEEGAMEDAPAEDEGAAAEEVPEDALEEPAEEPADEDNPFPI